MLRPREFRRLERPEDRLRSHFWFVGPITVGSKDRAPRSLQVGWTAAVLDQKKATKHQSESCDKSHSPHRKKDLAGRDRMREWRTHREQD